MMMVVVIFVVGMLWRNRRNRRVENRKNRFDNRLRKTFFVPFAVSRVVLSLVVLVDFGSAQRGPSVKKRTPLKEQWSPVGYNR